MRFLSIAGFSAIALFLWGWIFYTERYIPMLPHFGTQLAANFSTQQFDRVAPSMTEDEVLTALGEPLYRYDCLKEANAACIDAREGRDVEYSRSWHYSNDSGCIVPCDMAWVSYVVYFDQSGEVVGRDRTIYAD